MPSQEILKKCSLRLNLVAIFTEICKLSYKINIATELKTHCSIDDRLKFLKGAEPPIPLNPPLLRYSTK